MGTYRTINIKQQDGIYMNHSATHIITNYTFVDFAIIKIYLIFLLKYVPAT